jgi:hypothetical protein
MPSARNDHTACAVCGVPTSMDYHCKGSDFAIHWWESMDHDSSKEEAHHGAHYWCAKCWKGGVSVLVRGGVAVAMSPTKAMSALNVPSKSSSIPYHAMAKSTSKTTTSCNSDAKQRSAMPPTNKQKCTTSWANNTKMKSMNKRNTDCNLTVVNQRGTMSA